jgi:hypothetical protein
MADEQERKPLFWPLLFLGAFAAGALLWCVWMLAIVHKTQRIHPDEFYAPMEKSGVAVVTNGPKPGPPSNSVPVGTR